MKNCAKTDFQRPVLLVCMYMYLRNFRKNYQKSQKEKYVRIDFYVRTYNNEGSFSMNSYKLKICKAYTVNF